MSDWKDGFLLVGNHPVLDFLNTRPVLDSGAVELLPDFAALLRWFGAAGLLEARDLAALGRQWGESAATRRTVEAARELRERLRKEIVTYERGGVIHDSTLKELNRLMADFPKQSRLTASDGGFALQSFWHPRKPGDLLAMLAHSAAEMLSTIDRTRLRQCAHCVLQFYDISKKGTRRWCSMQLCGNRAKVAAYAARQKERNSDQ